MATLKKEQDAIKKETENKLLKNDHKNKIFNRRVR